MTGFLVEPYDVGGLAAAFQRLASDADLRARLGRAGREKIVREFDLHHNAATLAELFIGAGVVERPARDRTTAAT